MKRKSTLLVVLFFSFNFVYAQTWKWAKSIGGIGNEYFGSTAIDQFGNIYVTGGFADTIILGGTTLISAGSTDIFLAKYDSSGNVLWAKRAGGVNDDYSGCICLDASGNIYIAGDFRFPSCTFGSITVNIVGNGTDMFIAKYDPSGNVLWAHREGGTADDYPAALKTDAAGNLYMAAQLASDTVIFGSTTLLSTNFSGFLDVSVAKFDSSGNFLWAKNAGGSNDMYVNSFTTDVSGNVYIGGSYLSSTITFGATTLINSDSSEYTKDLYVAKYSANGNFLWAKGAGGNSDDEIMDVATDASGNLYGAGYFGSDSILFGTTALMNADTGGYGEDIFITKYAANGDVIWSKRAGMKGQENATSITTNDKENFYLAGYFLSDSLSLGSVALHNDTANTTDFFIAKYDSSGNNLWANSAASIGGSFYSYQTTMTSDTSGHTYVMGSFSSSSAIFGSDTVHNAKQGTYDIYLVKVIDNLACSASFNLFPDTSTLHNYWAVNYASGSPPLSYDWNWGDGSLHDFAAYPTHTYAAAGYYTICLTINDAATCTSTVCETNLLQIPSPSTMIHVNVVSSILTGIAGTSIEKNISIYPNPATENIVLLFNKKGTYNVQLYNMFGDALFEATTSQEEINIDVKNFPEGIYFVAVRDEKNNLVTKKIVKSNP